MSREEPVPFISPLRLVEAEPFAELRFGASPPDPEREGLRRAMNDDLSQLTREALPPRLAAEAQSLLAQYSDGDFFARFPVPAWSFLQGGPLGGALPAGVAGQARRAHGLALFLHLWDDHLCDGELAPDLLRLHLRTAAWQAWEAHCRALCRSLGADLALCSRHAARYLEALQRPAPAPDLPAYEAAFRESVAMWTVVPRLLAGRATPAAGGLGTALEAFFVAWRLLDDLQDMRADCLAGRTTAVALLLDAPGRRRWEACRDDGAAFDRLLRALPSQGLPARLLWRVAALLGEARAAAAPAWPGLATHIAHAALGPAAARLQPPPA